MISCDLFSKKEEKILRSAILKKIETIYVYTLQYANELEVCAFIQILLEENISLTITTGGFADNITILDELDFQNEKETYVKQEGVEMKVNVNSDFNRIIGERILDIECIQKPDEEYYWQLTFYFEKSVLDIRTLIDELKFSINNSIFFS